MRKTFPEAVRFLESFIPAPDKKHPGALGLSRMEHLVSLLGNPQLKYPTIHVGGTSGKGSTATMIASILSRRYAVGLHTSPHLEKITERIKIQSIDISDKDFIDLVNFIKPFVRKVEKSSLGAPSYFEIVTAMAFLYFYQQKVDYAVIEVGMGGRYDATNVIRPLVAVLTNVGLDHTEILGDTVEEIAEDKAGIIKPGIIVVSGVKQKTVIEIIYSKCKVQSAKLSLLGRDLKYKIKSVNEKGSVFDYKGENTYKNLKLSLLGEHQVENAALAIRTIELLSNLNSSGSISLALINQIHTGRGCVFGKLASSDIRQGLIDAFIPGRLEIVLKKPLVVLDGAHNAEKARALAAALRRMYPAKKIIAVIAIKNDKNARDILSSILPLCVSVVFTAFQLTADVGIVQSYPPRQLQKIALSIDAKKCMTIIEDTKTAVEMTVDNADKRDVIVVTGSLYLVGEVRKILLSRDFHH